jgi:hypothetical protein
VNHDNGLQPFGFREHASGLIVPAEHSREREVWTREEWRLIDRATKFLEGKGLKVYLRCEHSPACKKEPMDRIRQADGGVSLQCSHKDRIVLRAI